ncbi:LOW QUALITY PROTEIN: hypothetical protein TorRG33x02_325610, partial [Trema orientale]
EQFSFQTKAKYTRYFTLVSLSLHLLQPLFLLQKNTLQNPENFFKLKPRISGLSHDPLFSYSWFGINVEAKIQIGFEIFFFPPHYIQGLVILHIQVVEPLWISW